jgi:hypothetical protein
MLSAIGSPSNNQDFGRSLVVYDEETFLLGCGQRFRWDWDGGAFGEPYTMLVHDPGSRGKDETHSYCAVLGRPSTWPNPSQGHTSIQYNLDAKQPVAIDVYDVHGRLVRTLLRTEQEAGSHVVTWEGKNEMGEDVAEGVYLARLRGGRSTSSKKIVISGR